MRHTTGTWWATQSESAPVATATGPVSVSTCSAVFVATVTRVTLSLSMFAIHA
jgi:hypothetical protein